MSFDTEEFLIPSFMNLNLKFFSAQKQIRKFRRHKKPLVGTILPIGAELVFAAGAAPIFPLRIGQFEAEKMLRGTRLATNILGTSLVGAGTRILQPQAEGIINQFLKEYTQNLCGHETRSDNLGYPPDVCCATRLAYGSSLPYQERIKLFLAWGTRCGWFSQFYQTLHDSIPIAFTDIPKSLAPHAEEFMYEELQQLIKRLETLTGENVTDEILREKINIANEIKANYREVFYFLKNPKKMPLSPYAYMQFIALLNSSFTDYLSAIRYFQKNLKKLIQDLNKRKSIDYSDIPKILFAPVFSGSEPDLPQIINELGGCLIQADNLAYGMLDPVQMQGDIIRNYCDFLLKSHQCWSGSKTLVDSWIRTAKELNVDGIIFNRLIGCTSITPGYRIFKDCIRDTGLPTTVIDFNRIGENLAQIKNKLASFIELIKNE
ncbi:MAG: 2-hydroxyacyl-CoA dehydratase [Promethearchaeota archaeon]